MKLKQIIVLVTRSLFRFCSFVSEPAAQVDGSIPAVTAAAEMKKPTGNTYHTLIKHVFDVGLKQIHW